MQGWFLAIMGGSVIKWDIAWEELQEERRGPEEISVNLVDKFMITWHKKKRNFKRYERQSDQNFACNILTLIFFAYFLNFCYYSPLESQFVCFLIATRIHLSSVSL